MAKRCGAKTRSGGTCQRWARANGRCNLHGGKSPIGVGSPMFKTGAHSKLLPKRLVERYEQALNDPKLLELREGIALVDARLAELIAQMDDGEATELWMKLRRLRAEVFRARAHGDRDASIAAMNQILGLIDRGASQWMVWKDIYENLDRRRKLVQAESRRMMEAQQMVTVEQLNVFLSYLMQVLRRHVRDRHILAAISEDLRPILLGDVSGTA